MAGNTHIIHRVNLEIEVPEMRLANQVKDDAVRILYNDILPKLEKYMDTLVPADEHVQFNQLNINLENLTEEHFEQEFTRLIVQVLQEKTEKIIESAQIPKDQTDDEELVKYTTIESTLESFLFSLERGRLPWWSEKSGESLDEKNLSDALHHSTAEFQKRLLSLLSEDSSALKRLLNQYPIQFIFQHIFLSAKVQQGFGEEGLSRRILDWLQKFDSTGEPTLFNILNQPDLKFLPDEMRLEIESLFSNSQQVSDFSGKEDVGKNKQENISKKSRKRVEDEEGIFLESAGLILLHPFFDSLFKDFELLTEGQFKDVESQTKAVHLLHYLATKKELAAEYELVMEKFLCGWDPEVPIAREVKLSQEMKDECETLLKAAIIHWSALKNTSPDGLREGFLQREGKLILNDFQDRLIVENKAQDVLLSYLPWGYSIFKLPWMKNALYVDWV